MDAIAAQIYSASIITSSSSNELTFNEDDRSGILTPCNNMLLISASIMGYRVHRMMVDTGSYCNILFKKTLD
ncbi:hypothetical protein ACS0TY_032834 [Phlomoides rotata]